MRREAYSFRKFFKYPIKIYSIGGNDSKITFSRGIELRQIIVATLLLGIFLLFRHVINTFLPVTLQFAFYLVLPWLLAGAIFKKPLDGKRIDQFFIQYFRYLFKKNTRYSNSKSVCYSQLKKIQKYESIK